MGPRPEDRGEPAGAEGVRLCETLQWGHGPKTVERTWPRISVVPWSCFNGATARRPWRGRAPGGAKRPGIRFNGATARRPWRAHGRALLMPDYGAASMGPRPEDRGERPLPCSCCSASGASMGPRPEDRGEASRTATNRARNATRFNGATARRPWREDIQDWVRDLGWRLQWGHGPKTVESIRGPSGWVMAPLLQWGHGPKTVESDGRWRTP